MRRSDNGKGVCGIIACGLLGSGRIKSMTHERRNTMK